MQASSLAVRSLMRRRGSRTKRQRKKKLDYEGFQYGPLSLERFGRVIIQRAHWQPGEHERFRKLVRESRSEVKGEFEAARDELIEILRNHSPLLLLAHTSLESCIGFADRPKEAGPRGIESHLEYLLNIAAALPLREDPQPSDRKLAERVSELLDRVFRSAMLYFASEAAEEESDGIQQLRYNAIVRKLYLRGSSYPQHHLALIRSVFTAHDEVIRRKLGFSTEELIAAAQEIERQVTEGIRATPDWFDEMESLHQLFRDWAQSDEAQSVSSLEDLREAFLRLPGVLEARDRADALLRKGALNMFLLRESPALPQLVLEALSLRPGENSSFLEAPIAGSPLNRGGCHFRPLLRVGDNFFAFSPPILFRNLELILGSALTEADGRLRDSFAKSRHEVLLDLTVAHLQKLLPGCQTFRSLRYRPASTRPELVREVDLLVVFDEYLFFVEAKAGGFSERAQRGSPHSIASGIDELLLKAFQQVRSADDFLATAEDGAQFLDEHGREVLRLRANDFRRRFRVCVTLAEVGFLTAQLGHLQKLKAVPAGQLPWAVFVNDLGVVAEILEGPSDFLLYLERRLRVQEDARLRNIDELDYLMYYVLRGLYLDEENTRPYTQVSFLGFTDPLDRYYLALEGKIPPVEKPRRKIHPDIRRIAAVLEGSATPGRFEVASFLLGLDRRAQIELLENWGTLLTKLCGDGKSHGVNLQFLKESTCLSLVAGPSEDPAWFGPHRERNRLRKYQGKLNKCIGLFGAVRPDGSVDFTFEILEEEWRYDPALEAHLTEFQRRESDRAIERGDKPGRNDPCACGSGKKYKKCCGKGAT